MCASVHECPPTHTLAVVTKERIKGTVRWWKDEKGYGRITGDDGYVYFCHFSMVDRAEADENGYLSLRQGERVEFLPVPGGGAHGRHSAYNVRRI